MAHEFMDLREARRNLLKLAASGQIERVTLDQALGRVSAVSLSAPWALPREARSRMDGYAVRGCDTREASRKTPVSLNLRQETLAAGYSTQSRLNEGEAIRILAGAPLPLGADAVIPQENVTIAANRVMLSRPVPAGDWVCPCGGEVGLGERLLAEGEILTPTSLTMVASFGYASIPVYRRPRVALLGTGDELLEIGEWRDGPTNYCTTRMLMQWLVAQRGGEPIVLGLARDRREEICAQLDDCDADLVITSGGVGYGDRDLILEVWREVGVDTICRGINLTPGKKSAFGVKRNRLYCALPGNPWAAQVVFQELVTPFLNAVQGLRGYEVPELPAVLAKTIHIKKGWFKAIAGHVVWACSPLVFTPQENGVRSLFRQLRERNCYIVAAAELEQLSEGDRVLVRLHDFPLSAGHVFQQRTPGAEIGSNGDSC